MHMLGFNHKFETRSFLLSNLYSIIYWSLRTANLKSVKIGPHTLRKCCRVVKQRQAPSCVRIEQTHVAETVRNLVHT